MDTAEHTYLKKHSLRGRQCPVRSLREWKQRFVTGVEIPSIERPENLSSGSLASGSHSPHSAV